VIVQWYTVIVLYCDSAVVYSYSVVL
jgi:hypothetical protein